MPSWPQLRSRPSTALEEGDGSEAQQAGAPAADEEKAVPLSNASARTFWRAAGP